MLNQVYAPLKTCSDIQEMDKFMSLAAKAYETLVIEIHQRQFSSMQGRMKGACQKGKICFLPKRTGTDADAARI